MSPQATASAWAAVLDELEADLASAEALLEHRAGEPDERHSPAVAWEPPSDLGPLPAALQARARHVLARQRDATRRLALAARSTEAQRIFTSRVAGATHAPVGPAYLDVSA